MTAVESKEEISDTDSGIILHSGEEAAVIFNYKWQSINKNVAEMLTSGWMADHFFFSVGPDSPTSPIKDLTTHTRALKLKHQCLEERLELCLLELRKLCIREAVSEFEYSHNIQENNNNNIQNITFFLFFLIHIHFCVFFQELTGQLPSDYPLMPDEQPPRVRRRIGASFKLDEGLIHVDQQVQTTLTVVVILLQSNCSKCCTARQLLFNIITTFLHRRIQSCRHWKLTWLSSSRFMKLLVNSHWRGISANHRRRAGCSSARGRRRKWRICRRPCSSTGSKASATHPASPPEIVKIKVRDCTAP